MKCSTFLAAIAVSFASASALRVSHRENQLVKRAPADVLCWPACDSEGNKKSPPPTCAEGMDAGDIGENCFKCCYGNDPNGPVHKK
ncbi:small cysteine-rich protein [Pleurotus ostreatus PC15]|uniref:Small cysteine-rich protein n=1 Tax=Pleurotus ostreatus (strain PC15) TaxID=1137138 RepID=A0A067NGX3_PLEO1|nr:small cysteine-rich protein [Pleurotus ostreatus PC15]